MGQEVLAAFAINGSTARDIGAELFAEGRSRIK
jgi:hypothetical protein